MASTRDRGDAAADPYVSAVFSAAPIGMAVWGDDLRYVAVNGTLARINGCSEVAHRGVTPRDVLGGLGGEVEERVRQVQRSGRLLDTLLHGTTPAQPGVERVWQAAYFPVDARGARHGVGATVVDVTDRVAAEATLRDSEERFRLLVEGVRDYAIVMLDPDGRVVSWNVGAERILGHRADEILGRSHRALWPEELRDEVPPALLERAPGRRHGRGLARPPGRDTLLGAHRAHSDPRATRRPEGILEGRPRPVRAAGRGAGPSRQRVDAAQPRRLRARRRPRRRR